MTTNTVPSLACKGSGKNLGLSNGINNYGLYISTNDSIHIGSNTAYGQNIGSGGRSGLPTSARCVGITNDANNSGIITNTGTMSAVSSRCIIKY